MKPTKTIFLILLLIFSTGFGCKNFSRMMNNKGKIFTVEIGTDSADKNTVVENAVRVTQAKINAFGLDGEVTVDPENAGQILVKIYGSPEIENVKKFLFRAYQLELKQVVSSSYPSPVKIYSARAEAETVAGETSEILPYADENVPGRKETFVIVKKEPIVTGAEVRQAVAISKTGEEDDYQISFTLNKEGAQKFGDWTGRNINTYLAIVLDKKVQSMPYIRGQIFDSGEITGKFRKEDAESIALSLKSGYLPATMKIVSEKAF